MTARTTMRAALLAGTALAAVAWAAPAAAQLQPEPAACEQRIEEFERRIEAAGLPEGVRADLAQLVRTAETFHKNGNLEACAETLVQAEQVLEAAGGPAPAGQVQQAQGARQPGQAPAGEAGTAAAGAQIVVQQPQPQILIRQQPPLVTVRMPEPQVTVRIPEPEVIIRMPEPQVEVSMPEPEVRVEQRPPEVEVRMTQPEVELEQPEPEVRFEAAQAQAQVRVERAQARVEVQQGRPQVRFQPMEGQGQQQQQQQAGAAACEPRLARLEQVAQRLDLPPERRAEVERTLQDAAARLDAGDTEGCAVVLAEAEALIQGAGGPPEGQPALAQAVEGLEGAARAGEGMEQVTGAPVPAADVEEPGQEVAAVEPGEEAAAAGPEEIPILRLAPEEIVGADVYGATGEEIAEIEEIVRRVGEDALYAVLEVGGFLGVGEREVAVPLAEFELGPGDEIVLPVAAQEELRGLPPYDESEYEETGLED